MFAALALLAAGSASQSAPAQDQPASGSAANPTAVDKMKLPPGYLPREALPDSLALLPPPPAKGSAAMQRDEEARKAADKLRGTPRYARAASDAVIGFPQIPDDFACAMGIPIGKEATPKLYALMGRMLIDVGLSTYGAKNKYNRTRPFVAHKAATCYPKDEALLRNDGSYPSGHSAVGWGLALVLAEVNPDRADAIVQRGRDFGQSRVVCDAHWQSDVDAGRVIAAATVARLHGDAAFRADLDAARAEVAAARQTAATGESPACAAEAASLKLP
ncbi:acid phosphatase [Sphingomonas cavernae]|uniref:acid phosphatase n=1 Tax=Sphingomonas cavernae TaxID=2320861 RepID=UPI001EE5FFB4|nr:phosphatase PAP2 family protein [Sphingomonas cavernae]